MKSLDSLDDRGCVEVGSGRKSSGLNGHGEAWSVGGITHAENPFHCLWPMTSR